MLRDDARQVAATRPAQTAAAPPGLSVFEDCVFDRESTRSWAINTHNGYLGGFQFSPSTWASVVQRMGMGWALSSNAQDPIDGVVIATPAEQLAVFRYWEPKHPEAWPLTVPACGG